MDIQINLWSWTTVERAKLSEGIGQEQALILYNFSPINLEILDIETDHNKSRFLSSKYKIVSSVLLSININIWMSQFTEHNKKINQILFVQYDQSNQTHIHTLNVVAAFILELLSNSATAVLFRCISSFLGKCRKQAGAEPCQAQRSFSCGLV